MTVLYYNKLILTIYDYKVNKIITNRYYIIRVNQVQEIIKLFSNIIYESKTINRTIFT
jgi:hypothetical protein